MCDYNLKCFMSLGCMIDDIIMELYLNQENKEGIKYKTIMFTKIEENDVHLYKI